MKRASYSEAVAWISWNDDTASGSDEEVIATYLSTLLIADLFGVEAARVAKDVAKHRVKWVVSEEERKTVEWLKKTGEW
jgi:hypothetical protein